MKLKIYKSLFLSALLITSITACKEGNSIYDPEDISDEATPVINSITPEAGYLAGIDSITVIGKNFSNDPIELNIDFAGQPGTILNASETELTVRPAQVIGDSVPVRVSAHGALDFSNTYYYPLDQATFQAPGYNETRNTTGIASNAEGDIFFNLQNDEGANRGIWVWRTDDTIENITSSSFNWQNLKIGPNGLVYAVNGNFAVYRVDGGSIDTNPYIIGNEEENYRSIDFGKNNDYLWVVGDNENIIRANIDNLSIERFPFSANLKAVRYYDGQLFVGGTVANDTTDQVWKFDVVDDDLQNPQHLFTLDDELELEETTRLFDITFDMDGKMYISANMGTGIYTWTAEDGLEEMYQGLIQPTGYSLTWVDNFLVGSIKNQGQSTRYPLKIDIRKQGAPYYGIIN